MSIPSEVLWRELYSVVYDVDLPDPHLPPLPVVRVELTEFNGTTPTETLKLSLPLWKLVHQDWKSCLTGFSRGFIAAYAWEDDGGQ